MSRTRNEIDAQRAANAPDASNPFATLQDFYDVAVDLFYPVGSIIFRDSEQNPNTDYPGTTWVEFGGGRVLMSRSVTYPRGTTVGAYTHTLAVSEMPAHGHTADPPNTLSGAQTADHTHSGITGTESANHTHSGTTSGAGEHGHTSTTNVVHNLYPTPTGLGGTTSGYFEPNYPSTTNTEPNHAHGFTTGGVSASHNHGFTTTGISTGHQHYVNIAPFATENAGGGAAHNNIQPSVSVVVWKRTA